MSYANAAAAAASVPAIQLTRKQRTQMEWARESVGFYLQTSAANKGFVGGRGRWWCRVGEEGVMMGK